MGYDGGGSAVALAALASLLAAAIGVVQGSSEKAEDFFLDGVAWTSYRTAEKKLFFVNSATGLSTWVDPRKALVAQQNSLVGAVALLVTLAIIVAAGGAYVAYLVAKYPQYFSKKKKGKKTAAVASPGANKPASNSPAAGGKASRGSPGRAKAAAAKAD